MADLPDKYISCSISVINDCGARSGQRASALAWVGSLPRRALGSAPPSASIQTSFATQGVAVTLSARVSRSGPLLTEIGAANRVERLASKPRHQIRWADHGNHATEAVLTLITV
jgi:hypothetical protein